MSAIEITWFAMQTTPAELRRADAMAMALGLATLVRTTEQAMFQTERGGVIEFCTPSYRAPDYLFEGQSAVIGFRVANLNETAAALIKAGFELVREGGKAADVRFQHFRGPDGQIYGLIES